ncbi:CX3C chemokine receptor 1 [Aplysia californica]|uniref:CX3C chemokine receptor 1 n=1 Tax=Aplysia californica TaxID=6500 RepID=A0ABM0JC29_APLCA|nr:CX3C chemokine receptor 1 [Aplysia californica]
MDKTSHPCIPNGQENVAFSFTMNNSSKIDLFIPTDHSVIEPSTTSLPNETIPAFPIGIISAQDLLEAILSNYPEYTLASSLNQYGYLAEVVVGTVANTLALVVMLSLSRLPVCNYMAGLAFADLSVVLGVCLVRWLHTKGLDPRNQDTASCRVLTFMAYWSFSVSAWILVAMTIDRYLAITFPLKALVHSTPRRARLTIIGIMAVMALINIHFFVTMAVNYNKNGVTTTCQAYNEYAHFVDTVWPWLDATVYSFLPFFILLIFNFLIIKNHAKALRQNSFLKGSVKVENPNSAGRSNRKMTITLLTVSFTFMIMTAPRVILQIIRPTIFNFKPKPNTTDFEILARYTLTASLTNLFMYGNHCINFFLYCLTGNRFRQQLVHLVRSCYQRKLRRVFPANIDSVATEMTISKRRRSSESSSLSWRSDSNRGKNPEVSSIHSTDTQIATISVDGAHLTGVYQGKRIANIENKLVSISEENVETVENSSLSDRPEPLSSV